MDFGAEGQGPSLPFFAVAMCCEKVESTSLARKKKASTRKLMLEALLRCYGQQETFTLFRMLIPSFDKERGNYGIKEKKLAVLYINVLAIDKGAADASRMLNYRKPGKGNAKAGDFAQAVYQSLKHRCRQQPDRDVTVRYMDETLTRLAGASVEEKEQILSELLRKTTALEQKWLVRIIIKDMKLGVGEKTLLGLIHPNANEYMAVTSNLRKVCADLEGKDPEFNITASVQPFQHVMPMLAERAHFQDVLKIMGRGSALSGADNCVLEEKYDGERLQVHKKDGQFRLFSRHGHVQNPKYLAKLLPWLQRIASDEFILDSELLAYDPETKTFDAFGSIKTVAKEDEMSPNYSGRQLCLILFDVLYINGTSFLNKPLRQRLDMLRAITEGHLQEGRMQMARSWSVRSTDQVADAVQKAINLNQEGVMVKRLDSVYKPNGRGKEWLKIKPEYHQGVAEHMDMVVLGAFFGEGTGYRSGTPSSFIVGIRAPTMDREEWWTMCKVGTGYNRDELNTLQEKLRDLWLAYEPRTAPANIKFAGSERPDLVISDPNKSVIFEVFAGKIVPTEEFKTGFSLRFPRVVRIRYDKDASNPQDILTYEQLDRLANRDTAAIVSQGNRVIRSKRGTQSKDKRAGQYAVNRYVRPLYDKELANAQQVTTIFAGRNFVVENVHKSLGHSKAQLDILLKQNGAEVLQNPLGDETIIADKLTMRVKNLQKAGNMDIIRSEWVLLCLEKGRIVPLEPRFAVQLTDATYQAMLRDVDMYGISYREHSSAEQMRTILDTIRKDMAQERDTSGRITLEQIEDIEGDLFPMKRPAWSFFRGRRVYLDVYESLDDASTKLALTPLTVAGLQVRAFSGTVSPLLDSSVTDVIIDPRHLERAQDIKVRNAQLRGRNFRILTLNWVDACVRFGDVVDPGEYTLAYLENKLLHRAKKKRRRRDRK